MRTASLKALASSAALALGAAAAVGQAPIVVPQASPKAQISQTVGATEITIDYHRPAVNKRKVWGELVPYKQVWRAGANENTTIAFSTPVTVGGKTLAAGTYGIHMFPAEGDWEVAFSNQHQAPGEASATTRRRTRRASRSTRGPRRSRSGSPTGSTIRPTTT